MKRTSQTIQQNASYKCFENGFGSGNTSVITNHKDPLVHTTMQNVAAVLRVNRRQSQPDIHYIMLNIIPLPFKASTISILDVDNIRFPLTISATHVRSGKVKYGGIRPNSASPRPPCDGIPSASIWPSPRQTPCPYRSDRTPSDAIMKRVDAPSAWTSPSDLDKKESDGRDPPQGVAPHAHTGVVGASGHGLGHDLIIDLKGENNNETRGKPRHCHVFWCLTTEQAVQYSQDVHLPHSLFDQASTTVGSTPQWCFCWGTPPVKN